MSKRLVGLGLVAAVVQLFGSGCCPVARIRAARQCFDCPRPIISGIQARRAAIPDFHGPVAAGPVVGGPVVTGPVVPPCHGCGGGPPVGVPVGLSGGHHVGAVPVAGGEYPPIVVSGAPFNGTPFIGQPMPLPGPTVIPSNQLPNPMPVPKQ